MFPEIIVKITPIITTISDKNCVIGTVISFLRFVEINNVNKKTATTKESSNEISKIPDVSSGDKVNLSKFSKVCYFSVALKMPYVKIFFFCANLCANLG